MANEVTILVRAKDEASKVFGGVSGAASSMSKAVGVAALAGGAAIAGIGIASTKMAADFESSMAEVKTLLPGISQEGFGRLRQDVLDLSKEMGIATDQAVPALYQAISAGVPKENVATFMEVASKAAIGGVTDLETAVDGITSVTNAYGRENLSAQQAADIMFTAVKNGKTDFDQLSRSLFNVIPTAASLGVSFEDVTAQLAAMTAQGTPTSVATTQLRQAMVEASKSGTKLDLAIRDLAGKSFADLIAAGKTMPEIFNQLRGAMPEQEFKDLFGSVEAMNAALGVSGPNFATVSGFMDQAGDSAGAVDEAFKTVSETASFKFGKALNQVKVAMIEFGSMILPIAVRGIDLLQRGLDKAGGVLSGFRTILSGLTSGNIIQTGNGLAAMGFDTDQILAIQGTLMGFADFLRDTVIPAVGRLAEFVRDDVMPVLQRFASDVLGALVTTFREDVVPILATVADVFRDVLIPAVLDLAAAVQDHVFPKIKGLIDFIANNKEFLVGIAVAIMTLLVPAFIAWATAAGAAAVATIVATAPIIAIGIAIAALVGGIIWAIRHWDEITAAIGRFVEGAKGFLGDLTGWLRDRFFGFLDSKFAWLALALGPVGVLVAVYKFRDQLVGAFESVKEQLGGVFDWLSRRLDELKSAVQWVQDTIASLPTPGDVLGSIPTPGLPDFIPRFGFATGGVVPGPLGAPQVAVVHGGEEVRTPAQRNAAARAPSVTTPIQIYIGDRHFADLMVTGLVEAVSLGRVSPSVLPGGAA